MGAMRVVPLRDVGLPELEPVFEEEIQYWGTQIFWDYRATLDVIRSFLAAGTLPGLVMLEGSKVVGYSYYVIDQSVAFLGNLFVRNGSAGSRSYPLLVEQTIGAILADDTVRRIETQLFEFNYEFSACFQAAGFSVLPRHFMVRPIDGEPDDPGPLPDGWRLSHWQGKLLLPTAETVFDSYRGSFDATLCRDYRDRPGCLRFLKNLIENPACGVFSPTATILALDHFGQVGGVLLVTKTQNSTGMIPQISVRRDVQGRGLGSYLLRKLFFNCPSQGLDRVTLSVSDANQRAHRLYLRMGFQPLKEFNAYIWERG